MIGCKRAVLLAQGLGLDGNVRGHSIQPKTVIYFYEKKLGKRKFTEWNLQKLNFRFWLMTDQLFCLKICMELYVLYMYTRFSFRYGLSGTRRGSMTQASFESDRGMKEKEEIDDFWVLGTWFGGRFMMIVKGRLIDQEKKGSRFHKNDEKNPHNIGHSCF